MANRPRPAATPDATEPDLIEVAVEVEAGAGITSEPEAIESQPEVTASEPEAPAEFEIDFDTYAGHRRLDPFDRGLLRHAAGTFDRPLSAWDAALTLARGGNA